MTAGGERRTLTLKRYAPFEFDAPARKQIVVEFRQLEKLRPLTELPDLAIAREEVRGAGALELTVHNIGAAAARPFEVTVRDASGKLLGKSAGPALAPPDDLQPKTAAIRIEGVTPRAGLRIAATQQGGGDEICDDNNQVVLQ
jgi:hypothetical protein